MKNTLQITRRPRRAVLALAALAFGIALAGCTGTVGARGAVVYGYPAVYADVQPAQLAAYPRTWYNGSYAYLIDGSWYYPTTQGWVVFQQEPAELRSYRTRYVPSRRYYRDPGYGYPRERPRRYRPWR